jgi:uncharacterized protein (TIGR01777 family)
MEENKIHPANNNSAPRSVLVSGASGMVGTGVRQALLARGVGVLQLVRREPAAAGELRWNPAATQPFANPAQLEGLDAAIHLSGASVAARRWTPEYKREIEKSRVDSTRALAIALAGLRQPPQVLLAASATGVYGDRRDEILDERAGPGKGFLAELCRRWEAAAQPATDAGIRVANLRLGVVLGPGEGALGKMLPLFKLGLGGRLGSGQQWMSWVELKDAVAAILFLMDTPALAGPVNVTAPDPLTNAEFTRAVARAVHRPAILPAPAFALRLALGEMADEALLASARAVPARLIEAGFRFSYPSIDAALAAALSRAR